MADQTNYTTARLKQRFYFQDPDMDLTFVIALGYGPSGSLSVGEAFHVASEITNGDGDSWACAFENYGILQNKQADLWKSRGLIQAAGEARLKAFSAYRSAWQYVAPKDKRFAALYKSHEKLFDQAMVELDLPCTRFSVEYGGGKLPGHFLPAKDPAAPTILVIGGADTCHEDRFLGQGRDFWNYGYSVALVDLPGQGNVSEQGLCWEIEAEKPIGAVVDHLISQFGVNTNKLVLVGMSLGGYFVTRAAGYEHRFAAVIASTPLPRPAELFEKGVMNEFNDSAPQSAKKSFDAFLWKAGVATAPELIAKMRGMVADPALVKVPFLSVLGDQEGEEFKVQTKQWHDEIQSTKKTFLPLNAESGADIHCQVNNPLRLVQEIDAWLQEVL